MEILVYCFLHVVYPLEQNPKTENVVSLQTLNGLMNHAILGSMLVKLQLLSYYFLSFLRKLLMLRKRISSKIWLTPLEIYLQTHYVVS